ncbi:MAG: glycosyltransferase family 4 protein [Kiritimatiellales bacterium]|nr:glycosyltransferase family 4 protein [Kiritimatiellales bacterium]
MRILFCSHNSQLQGAPLNILRCARLLKERGIQCVISSPEDGPIREMSDEHCITFDIQPNLFHPKYSKECLMDIIKRHKPDIIFINTILGAAIVKNTKALFPHLPIIWNIRESERENFMNAYDYITPKSFELADAIIFVSEKTKQAYQDLDSGNMHVIHNGIDVEKIARSIDPKQKNTLKEKMGIPRNATTVVLVGSICPRKGQSEFISSGIRVAHRIGNKHPVRFVIVGKLHTNFRKYLELSLKRAEEEGYRDNFILLPEQQDMTNIYQMSDILVSNSFIESFPMVTLEAMAWGIPIIASNVYGVSEQIQNNINGLLFLPGHVSMLAEKLEYLILHPDIAQSLGEEAQRNVREKFTEDNMITKYIWHLNNLIEQKVS